MFHPSPYAQFSSTPTSCRQLFLPPLPSLCLYDLCVPAVTTTCNNSPFGKCYCQPCLFTKETHFELVTDSSQRGGRSEMFELSNLTSCSTYGTSLRYRGFLLRESGLAAGPPKTKKSTFPYKALLFCFEDLHIFWAGDVNRRRFVYSATRRMSQPTLSHSNLI